MSNVECGICGVTPADLPYEELGLDLDDVEDFLFEHHGYQWVCQGCAS